MHGLKKSCLLANQLLQKPLAPFGYYPVRHTPGLWLHKTRQISFSLIVDDFAVKYVGEQHADHLRNALLQSYEITTVWEAKVNSGMSLKWDYKNRTCGISMRGYVSNVLSKFRHDAPKHPQHTPAKLPHPQLRQTTDTHKSQRTLRSTQVRYAMARAYAVLLQNRPLRHLL
jgi:hypothetical protein